MVSSRRPNLPPTSSAQPPSRGSQGQGDRASHQEVARSSTIGQSTIDQSSAARRSSTTHGSTESAKQNDGTRPNGSSDRKGQIINQRYRILSTLGIGNSGTTYRAQCLKDKTRTVALKEVSLQGAQSWKLIQLFEREVSILKQLDHQAIPRYVDSFVVDSDSDRHFYLAQTLAEGKTLAAWVEDGWRCTEADVQDMAIQLLDILNYLQQRTPPVIHRDIKPLNIIRHQDGKLFLVDFGAVGHTYHNTFMRGSTVVGTFGYMAPEQFRGQACTATDLYSLGATLLYLLTRRSPAELPNQQLKVDFRSKVQLSDAFADWLAQLVEPSLQHRFSSASQALSRLKQLRQVASQDQGLLKPALKILGLLSALGLVALVGISQYKYSVLKHLGSNQELRAAIAAGDIPVEEYLAQGGEIALGGDQGQALLIFAVEQGDTASMTQLLEQGVSASQPNNEGATALHAAARQSDRQLLELLLESSQPSAQAQTAGSPLDLDQRDRKGNAPIHVVQTPENALLLMEAGADLNLLNHEGKSMLQTAVEQSWNLVTYEYLQRTQGVPQAVPTTPSLLAIAAREGNSKIVKMLVREGARFSRPDLLSFDASELSLPQYQEQRRNWFITGLPRLDALDNNGRTLLHDAIARQNWELGNFLLAWGADPSIPDQQGNRAYRLFDLQNHGLRFGYSQRSEPIYVFYQRLEKWEDIQSSLGSRYGSSKQNKARDKAWSRLQQDWKKSPQGY